VDVDRHYATLANNLNLEWVKCLVAKGTKLNRLNGYKAQQNFYRDVRNKDVKQVVIVSDALRYEVAKELLGELAKSKNVATLDFNIAMLPTETKFCKRSLFPHNKLELNGADMLVDGTDLAGVAQRSEFLKGYEEKAACVNFGCGREQSPDQQGTVQEPPCVCLPQHHRRGRTQRRHH